MHLFPPTAVRLLDGPVKDAQDAAVRYVLALDPDRLCAPYLQEAGLDPAAPGYGGWEGDGLGGHIGGHYLSACAHLWAATGDRRLRERLDHVLGELDRCQRAVGTGYVGGVPGGRALGEELAAGAVDADTFSLNGRWVPLYNLHKTLAGLLDAATVAGADRALAMATWFGDWWLSVTRPMGDALFEEMLRTEFGGMTDAFAELGALTGRADLVAEARRFAHRDLLAPLARGEDVLDGLHANTQIAKVVGWARLAATTGEDVHRDAARFFWRTVTRRRTSPIGGNSVREHFHPVDDFGPMVLDPQGPETCNTANMLELTTLLLGDDDGDAAELLDFYERATLNHVLSSQHPGRGGFVYFTPLRPAHYRVYSQPDTSMWCCVGTGMENHARYGRLVFGQVDDDLAVNLYLAAELREPWRGMSVRMEADLLASDTVVLHLAVDAPGERRVLLRRPGWAHDVRVEVDGVPVDVGRDGGYLVLRHAWSGAHTVTVRWATGLAVDPMPDGSAWASLRWGPVVLAGRDGADRLDGLLAGEERMGHVAGGPLRPLASTPVVAGPDVLAAATLRSRSPLRVDLTAWVEDAGTPTTVELEPFALLHDERYTVVWPTGADVVARRAELRRADEAAATDAEVVDEVVAGEQQPESDHAFAGERTRAATVEGTHRRNATGWFLYALRDPDASADTLELTFAEPRAGDERRHEVRVGDVVLGEPGAVHQEGGTVRSEHPVTAAMRAVGGDRLVVAVHARDGLRTGDLLRVRLLRHHTG